MKPRFLSNLLFVLVLMGLGGCVGSGKEIGPLIGPSIDSPDKLDASPYMGVRSDVVVMVFDPGIPEDPDDYEEEGIWPELRRTEANRFAIALKKALQATRIFGSVHVTPDTQVTGDLYVMGRIEESNGEDVEINVKVVDIAGKDWMDRNYEHRVKTYFWSNVRNEGEEPYQPVFDEAAEDIAELVRSRSDEELATLHHIAELRFAKAYAGGAFAEYIEERGGRVHLVGLPAENDPMLARIRALRVRDTLFMDQMQIHYAAFTQRTDKNYAAWQEHSLPEAKAKREAENEAVAKGILGALLTIGGAVAATQGYDNYDTGTFVAGAAAVGVGASLLGDSFQSRAESKVHADALTELGRSLDIEVAPQVIDLENKTVELTGNAREQFRQWRKFLERIYAEESTPNASL